VDQWSTLQKMARDRSRSRSPRRDRDRDREGDTAGIVVLSVVVVRDVFISVLRRVSVDAYQVDLFLPITRVMR